MFISTEKRIDDNSQRISLLHVAVVVLSLAMTLSAWLYAKNEVEKQISDRFTVASDSVIGLIVDRMSRYEDALWAGVAHIQASDGVTHQEWRSFSENLHLRDKYPGVNGIGVIYYLQRPDLPGFQAERDAENRDFAIFPAHEHDFLLPITFIEPEGINAAAVGLDVAHETNRREALLASRDSGEARITGPIVLVQDSGNTPGFLFYTPFYGSDQPGSVAERRERFQGVVYAPFVVSQLVKGLLSQDFRDVRFSIRDGDEIIYDEHSSIDAQTDPDPLYAKTIELNMYGRAWMVDIRTDLGFREKNTAQQPLLILIGGLIIEALIITLIVLLMRSNQKAHEYAQSLTADLLAKTEHLRKANDEIEQFVYVASHDLKTPTRGIAFLTDMIEEDLEEEFGQLPDGSMVRGNLDLIRERVNRMNELTAGIMEYSRVGKADKKPENQIVFHSLLKDFVTDFGVREDQLSIDTDVDFVSSDTSMFRRVMENLVGNAFKYHPDKETAQVHITIKDLGESLDCSVKDNGRGIPQEYQAKIFDVFQTLENPDVSGTGIGLAIVKKAVEMHGGQIRVISKEGDGATFNFTWPKNLDTNDERNNQLPREAA